LSVVAHGARGVVRPIGVYFEMIHDFLEGPACVIDKPMAASRTASTPICAAWNDAIWRRRTVMTSLLSRDAITRTNGRNAAVCRLGTGGPARRAATGNPPAANRRSDPSRDVTNHRARAMVIRCEVEINGGSVSAVRFASIAIPLGVDDGQGGGG
jgi:hypothetical protein